MFVDVWRPSPAHSTNGACYYIAFVDVFSKFFWFYLLHSSPFLTNDGILHCLICSHTDLLRENTVTSLILVLFCLLLLVFLLNFLNEELDKIVYMQQYPGFVSTDSSFVRQPKKAIYGQNQALRSWFQKLSLTPTSFGLTSTKCYPSLFVKF